MTTFLRFASLFVALNKAAASERVYASKLARINWAVKRGYLVPTSSGYWNDRRGRGYDVEMANRYAQLTWDAHNFPGSTKEGAGTVPSPDLLRLFSKPQ